MKVEIDPPIGYYDRTVDFISTFKDKTLTTKYKRFPVERSIIKNQPKGVEAINWHYQVKLSTLSFLEKIELFHCAEVIVSPHGAGLTNLIFCNPGTKIVEMFTPTYLMPCFHIISNHMELDYYGLIGEKVPPDDNRSTHKDPIVIDIVKLKKTLEMASIPMADKN
jgi:hypothetical protein